MRSFQPSTQENNYLDKGDLHSLFISCSSTYYMTSL